MKYMGSKRRLAKHILPIILKGRKEGQYYVEPFVGGGNLIDKVDGPRIGADANEYAIAGLTMIRDRLDEIPKNNKEFTEEDYNRLKLQYRDGEVEDPQLTGYAGFELSFGGKFFDGWRRCSKNRDYVKEGFNNVAKQSTLLKNVTLVHSSYEDLVLPENSLIYCDPPYANTKKYVKEIDHVHFWNWCRLMVKKGHTVFVSEYSAPEDFVAVFEQPLRSDLRRHSKEQSVEKLFIHVSQQEG